MIQNPDLKALEPVCKAISLLMPEMVEVVLHDLATNTIAHIENGFSARDAGDDSLLETENYAAELDEHGIIGPYRKSSPDGTRLKSVSAVFRDAEGQPIGLLCINFKTGDLETVSALLSTIARLDEKSQPSIVKNDWRELTNAIIEDTLKDLKIVHSQLRRPARIEIMRRLMQADVLSARGSGDYVAKALGVSRANFYDMLREAKHDNKEASA
ncbi:transcriptional regulator [Roseibium sp. MMSF_3412]|uniref:helix-turn-helix transcriptional regulator n=1 Tax=Roseibium sp. MMSF_3412 TaxID=3046712 RepID=UPI00273F90D0|nr:PAS domain-containing protein [Roseibium sp. MMSF_3412]